MRDDSKKFRVTTLGCRTNQYESQAYADQLRALGYVEAARDETAEICIVNTCTVTQSADRDSRAQIRALARRNPGAQLLVTGCLAERLPEEIGKIAGVTHVVPNKNKENLLKVVFPEEGLPEFSIQQFAAHTRAFVKVQDGCNSFCTYCIIPYVRGRSRSRRVEDVVKEVKGLVANGYKEVVITGINVGDFDGAPNEGEEKVSLAQLVREVDKIEGLERIRVSSIDPDEVDDNLTDAIMNGKKTCPSMHIVLQAGSNVVLKRMNRKYTRQIFLETVERLRTHNPDFTFTTDIIVGFPGETEIDFEETLDVMRQVKFAKVHMFPYSERDRTRAALFSGKVPQEEIERRRQTVLREAEKLAFELREKYVGRTQRVLIEGSSSPRDGFVSGHTENFLPVLIPAAGMERNTIVDVVCQTNEPDGLVGAVCR
jgi:threonylcarbamoyladenosine tRNA methylthiotransferase MtaB